MQATKIHIKLRFIQTGCLTLCMFYLLGLFNGLVLETLHKASHMLAPTTHSHTFASEHEMIDYSSLEAMAGHSHEALEALKDLLEANQPGSHESKDEISLKLDKHVVEQSNIDFEISTSTTTNNPWNYQSVGSFWYRSVSTPPPQNS